MKILVLTSSFPRFLGDYQGNFIFHLARGQVERGNTVHVLCPHIPGTPFRETLEGVEVFRFPYFFPCGLERLSSDTGMYSALRHSLIAWLQLPLFFLCQGDAAVRLIRSRDIDIVHAHWIVPQGLTGYLCAKIRKKPLVISSHVLDAQVFSRWPVFVPLLRKILSGCSLLTTNSTFTKNVIERLCPVPCPIRVIPMGVTPAGDAGRTEDSVREPRILFVGRLIEWKGVDILIRAMAIVLKRYPAAMLSLVGDGPERSPLEALVRESAIEDKVCFHGRVSDSELASLYSRSSVFVLPSRSSRGIVMEGLGVVLLEAMAHGVPVIGSNVGGIPDIIRHGENGFLFPEGDEKILADNISMLLSDTERIDRFRQAGYETIRKRFSWDVVSQQFFEEYSELQRSKTARGENR